jgi:hypothetical protein
VLAALESAGIPVMIPFGQGSHLTSRRSFYPKAISSAFGSSRFSRWADALWPTLD